MAQRNLIHLPMSRVATSDSRAVTNVYKPFFVAGIVSVLTAGCMLGAIALIGISLAKSYATSVWTPYVLAHANSQVYGWVGFFVMGFSLQQHAPRVGRLTLFNRLAWVSLLLVSIGIALRFVAEPMTQINQAWVSVGILSGILQAVAVVAFIANIGLTRFKTGAGLTWPTFLVFASLTWWLIVAIAEPIYFAHSHQVDAQASIFFVAEYFPPYRDAQFLGFVTLMIFGVASVKMNSCFGARPALKTLGIISFLVWSAALVMRIAGWIKYFETGFDPSSYALYSLAGYGLALSGLGLVASTRLFEPLETRLASHKFVRAAMVWFVLGGLMLAAEPLYLSKVGLPFSHAFIGAARHALTVGFISQMIIGVGLHVASQMNDLPTKMQPALWTTFWMLNIGNAIRVFCELATDTYPAAFKPMGLSGAIELTGLAFWAWAMISIVALNKKTQHA